MSIVDLKMLRKMIKDSIDREQTAHILTGLGYEVRRDWKFALREDERTPSVSIRQDGLITDFGDDWSGDIVALLHEKRGLSLRDSTLYVCEQMGISTNESYEHIPLPVKRKPQLPQELTGEKYKEIISFIARCDASDKQTFIDGGYKQSALSIAPMWVYKQAEDSDIQLFKEFTTYDEGERSIVLKIRDYSGKLISYKHRYKGNAKWRTATATHPNKQCMVSIQNPNDYLYPIYVVEGARDFLMMVLMGLNVIAIPTVQYREWSDRELSIFRGKNVVLIPDLDPKQSGIACMLNLGRQADKVTKSANVIDIRKMLELMEIECDEEKIDFSDVVNMWNLKDMEAFRNTLLCVGDVNVMLPEGESI